MTGPQDDPNSLQTTSSDAGFTLVETLVAIALLGLLGAIMVGSISHLARLSTIARTNDGRLEIEALTEHVAQTMSRALNLPLMDSSASQRHYMTGTSDGVRFVAVAQTGTERRALREVEFRVVENDGLRTLLQRTSPRRFAANNAVAAETDTNLADRLTNVKFYYRTATDQNWQDTWSVPLARPHAIRIDVDAMRHGKRISSSKTVTLFGR